ncbi:uncharacterized protein PV06_01760 [Exophiala oligosperma]|uniref:Methyltransferase domain-containing protein n=1 Tax=Exophiala oligosperma TaxID=215243 RepID=A0A0D2DSR0_9EURO|nr:uncharacterized protein PV06_01760 [Exophiala oligosperma]KIW46068.1 hypothetical protein PV06_01760 [Exophiala oligosperma]
MSSQSQYDEIGLSYESLKAQPAALVERANLRAVITPLLLSSPRRGGRPSTHPDDRDDDDEKEEVSVLDLACGTGYYSRLVLSWGASRVVGVDISSAMIEAARSQSEDSSRLTFLVGDCSRPLSLKNAWSEKEERFDIVLGAWLLNYASSPSDLVSMFGNVSSHLKPGGHFVGVTPHPATDLDSFAELFDPSKTKNRDRAKYGATVEYTAKLPGGHGYRAKVTAHVKPREISFESFHLKREVYENAARDGGLEGELKWVDVQLPRTNDESKTGYGVDLDFWEGYLDAPHFGILVVEK